MIKIAFGILVSVTCAEGKINPGGPTVITDFSNCMDHLIEQNFDEKGLIIFATSKDVSKSVSRIRNELLTRIHARIKYSVKTMHPRNNEVNVCELYDEKLGITHVNRYETQPSAAYFIIMLDKFKDFPFLTSRLLRLRSWNPTAKFIILLLDDSTVNYNKYVEAMLSCLFKYNVIDVMVLGPDPNKIRNAFVYSWKPFDPPKYCGYYNETAYNRVYVDNKCVKGRLLENSKTIKIPNDMKGCVLQMIALERQPFVSDKDPYANLEKTLINEVVGTHNFKTSYEIINTVRGDRIDGQWTGAFKELASKRGQILLGGIFPDDDVHEDFECSIGYLADSYTWVLPKAYKKPPWKSLSGIFQRFVWYSIIVGFSLCAIFWRILGQLSRDTVYNKSLHHCFLNSWISTLGFCAYLRPKTQSLRLFFCFFSLYCTIIITAYQTKLIDVLKNPTYEYQIKNVKELVESGLKFGGFEELLDLFSDRSDPLDNIISKNWITVVDNERAMLDVTVHRNFSVLCSRTELAHISAVTPEVSDSVGNYRYYAFEGSTFSIPLEMVALRGFAFMKKFSTTLGTFKQSGINEAIRRRFAFMYEHRRANLLRQILEEKSEVNALSLRHLQSGFIFLMFGYVSGTIMFLLEIIVNTTFVKQKMVKIKRKIYHRKLR